MNALAPARRDYPTAFTPVRRALTVASSPPSRALVASGSQVALSTAGSIQLRRERQAWQRLAWQYFRSVGIAWYLNVFKSNAISRLRLYPARITASDQDPIPIDDPNSLQQVVLDDMASGYASATIGHAGMLAMATLHWEVPGEFYWHAFVDEASGRNVHEILSITELEPWGLNGVQIRRLPSVAPTPVGKNDRLIRIWNPHPEFQQMATSPMVAQLDTLEEMALLIDAGVAAAKSRLSSVGILTIPDQLDYKGAPKPDGSATAFEEEFLQVGTTAIKNPRSAGRWMPFILRGQAEYMTPQYLRWITGTEGATKDQLARLQTLRDMFCQDMNLPTEISKIGDMTHWNAWIVDAMTWPHLQPIAVGMLTSLSRSVFQPLLIAGGMSPGEAAENVIWFDESQVVSAQDRSTAATTGVNLGYIGAEAWRRHNGFEEDDAPSPAEYARTFGFRWGDPGLAGSGDWAKATGRIATRVTETESGKSGEGVVAQEGAAPTAGPPPEGPALPNPGPPSPGPPSPSPTHAPPAPSGRPAAPARSTSQPQSVAASADPAARRRAKLAKLGPRLSAIDRDLMLRLSVLADASLHTAVRHVGSRAWSAAQGRDLIVQQIRGLDKLMVPRAVGPDRLKALGIDTHALIQQAAEAFGARAKPWLAAAQASAVSRIAEGTEQDPDALDAQTADDRARWLDVAEGILVTGFAAAAQRFLFHPDRATAPTRGEVSDLVAPRSAIRDALAAAGGAAAETGPPLGIGGGPMAQDLLASGGATVDGWTWNYTDSARSTFPGHLALDGVQFASWTDDALLVQPEDDWVDSAPFYSLGDHPGCSCDATQTVIPVEDLAPGDGEESE